MSTFDVRSVAETPVYKIVFEDADRALKGVYGADEIQEGGVIGATIKSSGEGECVTIFDKVHALNLIKALNKAIELGWLK